MVRKLPIKTLPMKKPVAFFILPEYPPSFGGMQAHAIKMVEHFKKYFSLHIYIYKTAGYSENIITEDFIIHPVLTRISFFHNLKILLQDIEKYSPQLIYSSTIFYGYLKNFTEVPVVSRSIGNDLLRPWILYPLRFGSSLLASNPMEKAVEYFKRNAYKPPYITWFFKEKRKEISYESARKNYHIFANSHFTYNLLQEIGVQNVEVLSGGVDTKLFHPVSSEEKYFLRRELRLPQDKFILMNACRFVAKKGLDFLIRNFISLNRYYDDLFLVLIGGGGLHKKIRKWTRGLENVLIISPQEQSELVKFYQTADVFTMTSYVVENPLTGEKDVETMGRTLCEANASGLPVISSATGGTPSIIRHGFNGLLFPEKDSLAFHKQFALLYETSELREKLVQNGLFMAREKWDWKNILAAHERVFEKLSPFLPVSVP